MTSQTGGGSLYTWNTSDGTPAFQNVTNQTLTYQYTKKGSYNLTAETFNAISSKSNSTIVIVQDEVRGLVITTVTAPSKELHTYKV